MNVRSLSLSSWVVAWFVMLPAVASGEILWRGDFETEDLSQWDSLLNPTRGARQNINVVTTPVRSGAHAAEIVIHPDDLWPGNNHNRVELHYDAVEARTAEGQTTFFSFHFRLPANAQTTNDIAYWETATSFQQSMAFWVQPSGGGTQLSFRTNRPSAMTHYNGPITVDAWHQLAMQILWSQNAGTGRVSVWLDGQRVVNDVAAQTKPDANRLFVQVGYHRNATATPVETIFIDDALEATALADILPPAGGAGGIGGAGTGGSASGNGGAGGATAGDGGDAGAATSGAAGEGGRAQGGASGASGVAGAATAGAPGSAGTSSGGESSAPGGGDEGGCGCRIVGKSGPAWPLALLVLGALLRRRRR